jgi:putative ABC transport system substrate-binding protein
MRRRDFISLLGGAAASWPGAVSAQPAMPVIGFLNSGAAQAFAHLAGAFRMGLGEIGYVEDENVAIEYRWANGQYNRLPELAADLIGRQVAIIAAGGPPAARAAKAATSIVPIVFTSGDDPVQAGFVSSLNRPGGNITGVHLLITELNAKKLGLLRDLLPQVKGIAALLNPTSQNAEIQSDELQTAGRALGLQIEIVNASSELEIEVAFATFAQQSVGALVVGNDPFFVIRREQIVALAARHAIPAVYDLREYAEGGLITYGTSLRDAYRKVGIYVGRILKGERAADLPVLRSTKFEFIINLKTANALGLAVPNSMQLLADEVIE